MTDVQIVEKTEVFVKETLKNAEGGHDWFHIERVLKNALLIAKEEQVNIIVVHLGALLHDIADAKFHQGDETLGPKKAKEFLNSLGIAADIREHVVQIIRNISFKNSLDQDQKEKFNSKELQVVRDADRLDAIGAIGIARTFNYGGYKNRQLYNPDIPPNYNMDKETYKNSNTPTINHFYEKLLLLKERMHTKTGKRLAENRHQFMLYYLDQFYAEWEGKL
ncbi:MAG: HD domain-containing protein [Bacteroidota bacterium]